MNIRKANLEDCMLISQLAAQTFPWTYRNILTKEQIDYMMDWMYSLPNLQQQMKDGHTFYIISSETGSPCGYVSVRLESGTLYHLEKIYVLPEAQGKGYGKALFLQAEEHVRKQANRVTATMELNVNRYNKALNFYKKMGMTCDRQGDFPIGNGYYMNDYIMKIEIPPRP